MPNKLKEFFIKHSRNTWFCLTCILPAACLAMLAIPLVGIPDGYDLAQHLQFAVTYYDAMLAGDFFPGWAAPENFGFGSIGIRYYPPFAYYLLAVTQMLTGSWYETVWINSFVWMFAGCIGIFLWAKEWLTPPQATAAAVFYAIAPYHLLQIYQVLLYAEFAASGVLPFCFLFITRLIRRGRAVDVLLFSASVSLLLLTHIPSTIMGAMALGVYALFLIEWKNFKRIFLNFAIAFSLTLASTAFHWSKLVTELNWVKHNTERFYANGYYDYKQYLFPMIYSAGERYVQKMLWHLDIPIIFAFLMILPLAVYLVLDRKTKQESDSDKKLFTALTATGFFSIFIMTLPSLPIWNSFSVLQKVQFPWRWLSIAMITGVLAFVIAVPRLMSRIGNFKKPFVYSVVFFILAIILFNITQNIIPAEPLPREKFAEKLVGLREKDGCSCWWTIWAEDTAFANKEKVSAGSREVIVTSWKSESREFTVSEGEAQTVRIATFYHPHWKAEINGNAVKVEMDKDGTILIPVAGENSTVKLFFEEPALINFALIVSLLTWLLMLGALLFFYRRRDKFRIGLAKID